MTVPAPSTSWRMYLLSTLEFDVGTPVRLYGAIQAASTQEASELTFVLGKDMPWDPHLLPAGQSTQQVDAPLGMTGVRLQDFQVAARLRRASGGDAEVNLALRAAARFTSPSLASFVLDGALVLDKPAQAPSISPRLALVRLSTSQPLTLTQLVTGVLGGDWAWADAVTGAFAFRSGDLYYLRPPDGAGEGYTYTYTAPGLDPLVCKPGYHADAVLRILDRYDFAIGLAVVPQTGGGNAISLAGTLRQTLDFDFVQLVNPGLEISTVAGNTYLRVQSGVTVFGTALQLSAGYSTATSSFVGQVTTVVSGSTVGVEVAWTRGSFRITRIIGLPTPILDLVNDLTKALNAGGGCEKIVSDWLKGLTQTSFGLALDGIPSKPSPAGSTMNVPLKVTYSLTAEGSSVASATLPFTATFEIPTSLSGLPVAIAQSLVESAPNFAQRMLENPDTYRVIALEAARRGGASALARFICRALEKGLQSLAQALADAAASVVAATLAEAAELAAAVAGVAVAGLAGIVGLLETVWDWLTGKDDDKKREAEDRIRAAGNQIASALKPLTDVVSRVRALLVIPSLPVSVDAAGEFSASWTAPAPGEGLQVSYDFALLQGTAGTATAAVWPGFTRVTLPAGATRYAVPLDRIQDVLHFGMNASVVATATGFDFLSQATQTSLQDAITRLAGLDNDVARDVAAQLQRQLDTLVEVNGKPLVGPPVYASYQAPATLTVGQGRVGLTTRLGRRG